MKLKAVRDNVLIEMKQAEDKVGDIIIPQAHKEAPQNGLVVSIGGDVTCCKVGDRVLINKYGGSVLTLNNKTHRIVSDKEIIGIIE